MDVHKYSKSLTERTKGKYEVDVILLVTVFNFELHIYYIEEALLKKQIFSLSSTSRERDRIRLYLGSDGEFDIVYDKETIRAAGICQAIILEVKLVNKKLGTRYSSW